MTFVDFLSMILNENLSILTKSRLYPRSTLFTRTLTLCGLFIIGINPSLPSWIFSIPVSYSWKSKREKTVARVRYNSASASLGSTGYAVIRKAGHFSPERKKFKKIGAKKETRTEGG